MADSAVLVRSGATITRVACALYRIPLTEPVSDAKVVQGKQQPLGGLLPAQQLAGGERANGVYQQLGFGARLSVGGEHLVVEILDIIAVKFHGTLSRPRAIGPPDPEEARTMKSEIALEVNAAMR